MVCADGKMLVLGAQGAVARRAAAHWHSACCGGATGNMQCSDADVVKLERFGVGRCALCALDAVLALPWSWPWPLQSPMDKAGRAFSMRVASCASMGGFD